jgi:transposase InsO family protein
MKNVVKLDNYYCPDELNASLKQFVYHYNQYRYHESLENLTPADVYWGRREEIRMQRANIKQQTMVKRTTLYLLEKLKI